MMTLMELWNLHRDPVHFGWARRGVSFGTTVKCGLSGWSVPDGVQGDESVAAVALFRGVGSPTNIDYDYCVGLAPGKVTSVDESTVFTRDASTWYCFDVRAINGAGVIGDPGADPVRIHTDDTGAVEEIPNPPAYVSGVALPGGKARVAVGYSPDGECVSPTDLQVFLKELTDPYDASDLSGLYDTPLVDDVTGLSAMAFTANTFRYEFNVPVQTDGTYIFAARFRNGSAEGDGNDVISPVIEISDNLPATDVEFAVS